MPRFGRSFTKTEKYLQRIYGMNLHSILARYGEMGVAVLAEATPRDTGEAAASWKYSVNKTRKGWTLSWTNTELADKTPVVILIQYGHATGTGGYVTGRDFINAATQPIFDKIVEDIWNEVTKT